MDMAQPDQTRAAAVQNGSSTTPTPGTNEAEEAAPNITLRPTQSLHHPFYNLPAELILSIIDLLPPEAFINFAFANYPLLHTRGLAPALSLSRVAYLTSQTQLPALFPLLRLPPEITLQVLTILKPLDVMRFVLANYQDLARQGIAPSMTFETLTQLRSAVRSEMRPNG